jgi:hypothetical protein
VPNSPREQDGYQFFIERSKQPQARSDENWRLGFELKHRDIDVVSLAKHIFTTMNLISPISIGDIVIDIGAGGGQLAKELEKLYSSAGARYLMIDSKEVLDLGYTPKYEPIYGSFPQNLHAVLNRINAENSVVRHLIANSILHYVRYDGLLNDFFDAIVHILPENGVSFIGDIPCQELKQAQAIVENRIYNPSPNNFTYQEFANYAQTLAIKGTSFYLIPQPVSFPMSPHRLDILLHKNRVSTIWNS